MNILEPMSLVNEEVEKELLTEGEETISSGEERKKLFGRFDVPKMPGFKPIPWKAFNKKNLVLGSCLVLLAVAGFLNFQYAGSPKIPVNEEAEAVIETPAPQAEESDNYFASAVLNRERVRDEAIDVYKNISENASVTSLEKENAISQIVALADRTSSEINIENLVKAKGFEECVAVINNTDCNVVVRSDGLTEGQVAQIKEIVYLEASIHPNNIKIIEK